jgi:phosphoribosylaminoimidazolecarboxamide formyltransferase/IMP cyclohydrolase
VILVEEITKFPEILGGRVKTIHPKIFGGVLAKKNDEKSQKELEENSIDAIDMVVVNFYPFEKVLSEHKYSLDEMIEYIDIGGPSLVRAAAKNHKNSVAVIDPEYYSDILKTLRNNDKSVPVEQSLDFAKKVFVKTAYYDSVISNYLASEDLPEFKILAMEKIQELRYGENPHQSAGFYKVFSKDLNWKKLHGKELSYNNIADMDSAIRLVCEFDGPCCGIIKHANPCGVGIGDNERIALERALKADPVSAFGGIFSFNTEVSEGTAQDLSKMFFEVIAAPSFTEGALKVLMEKKNLRIIEFSKDDMKDKKFELKSVENGYIFQETDSFKVKASDWNAVSERQPADEELKAMDFAWKVVKYVKSNAVIFCNSEMTLGVGAGQMSRVDSCKIAVLKSSEQKLDLKGSVAASDAFFPFRDGLDVIAGAGATAVIQPGGSIRDNEVIEAANEFNMAMVFTGERHFRH